MAAGIYHSYFVSRNLSPALRLYKRFMKFVDCLFTPSIPPSLIHAILSSHYHPSLNKCRNRTSKTRLQALANFQNVWRLWSSGQTYITPQEPILTFCGRLHRFSASRLAHSHDLLFLLTDLTIVQSTANFRGATSLAYTGIDFEVSF